MAVISTFDQWQKDVFFSAAEEVQESADTMESAYRMWVRGRVDGFEPEFLDELRRELHTTLGTAKWQLEEFERAVSLSHEDLPSEDNTITRHREFIAAIRNKITYIEKALNNSLFEEGKQPLRWVQLDKEERDDFEMFLSMAPQNPQGNKDRRVNHEPTRGIKDTVTINKDAEYVMEVVSTRHFGTQEEVIMQEDKLNGQRRTGGVEDIGAWKIVIADEEDVDKKLVEARAETHNRASRLRGFLRSFKSRAKLKWFRFSSGKAKSGEHLESGQGFSNYLDLKRIGLVVQGTNGLSEGSRNYVSCSKESPKGSTIQQSGRVGLRHFQGTQSNIRSLRVTLLLVLTIFLVVPFLLYST